MANREIPKIPINSKRILKEMKNYDISFRSLEKTMGISDRQLRMYVKEGKAPPYIVKQLSEALGIAPFALIASKTIWMQIGVTVPVTDEVYDSLIRDSRYGLDNVYVDEGMAAEYLRMAVVDDGEAYIPASCFIKKEWEEQYYAELGRRNS